MGSRRRAGLGRSHHKSTDSASFLPLNPPPPSTSVPIHRHRPPAIAHAGARRQPPPWTQSTSPPPPTRSISLSLSLPLAETFSLSVSLFERGGGGRWLFPFHDYPDGDDRLGSCRYLGLQQGGSSSSSSSCRTADAVAWGAAQQQKRQRCQVNHSRLVSFAPRPPPPFRPPSLID
jgi:hypothetical protein